MKTITFLFALLFIVGCSTLNNNYDSDLSFGGVNQSDDGESGDRFTDYGENIFLSAEDNPLSSFSVDADGASYSVMRKYVTEERTVQRASVRVEEFLNYFTFDYPEPLNNNKLSVTSEVTKAPWNEEHYLLRVGLKGQTVDSEQLPPSNYVFLVDVSGSMSSSDKLDLAKEGFMTLALHLRDDDRVTIVTYSGKVDMVLEPTLGRDRTLISKAISSLSASGSTNGGNALEMAYKAAKDYYVEGGNNRVIMATDGDFNVGVTGDDALVEMIESYLDSGIYLTVLGFGTGNLNDSMMEQIANHGNGNYEYIDNPKQIRKVFVEELSKLYPVAKDTKVQLDFNSEHVEKYRLIGYENRVMSQEDFDDTKKDAGEIGSGQTITALYEIIPTKNGTADKLADIKIRYKEVDSDEDIELTHSVVMSHEDIVSASLSENQQFAAAVAMFGLYLKDSEFKGITTKSLITEYAEGALGYDPNGYRKEFINLVNAARAE